MWRTIALVAVLVTVCSGYGCLRLRSEYRGEHDGHYCVCNSTYCDEAPSFKGSYNDIYRLVSSSKGGLRYSFVSGMLKKNCPFNRQLGRITIDRFHLHQRILGFGGAITDSTGQNIESLSMPAREKLMKSYFGPTSSEYTFIRTPMGGTDFSTRPYSYLMTKGDVKLKNFHLQEEDFLYKIPYIQWAQELSKRELKLLTAPWSPSPWMKTEDTWTVKGKLRREYWQLWADYFVRYFDEYKKHGIEFWGTSAQNEPAISTYLDTLINGLTWTAEEQRDWIVQYLAPTLKKHGYGKLKILASDDNRPVHPEWSRVMFENDTIRDVLAGTALHWYFDTQLPVTILDEIRDLAPEKLMMYTEACTGVMVAEGENVILGSWQRGQDYAESIIDTFNHWVSSWVDWNMALNMEGGPTWISNFVDSPIIVNAEKDEFYKQPMYYVLGHFSKYVPPDSFRISSASKNLDGVKHIAFLTPDHATVVVVLNTNENKVPLAIDDPNRGTCATFTMPPKSIHTFVYW